MYLTFKKKDSVSSILLFIFNAFLVERGIYSVSLKKIFKILEPFQKNETAIRMGLSRGVQNGLLVNEKQGYEVYYRITDKAVQGVRYWQETLKLFRERIPLQTGDWDGVWSLLHIVPAGDKKDAENFTDALRQAGYGNLGGSLWISPHDLTGMARDLAEKYGLAGGICQFRGRMAGDADEADIAARVWPLEKIAQRYRLYGQLLEEEAVRLDSDSYGGGGGLPFLHRCGLDLFEIIQDDPQLPLKLLPSGWPGLQAAGAFLGMREKVLPKANGFISRILAE